MFGPGNGAGKAIREIWRWYAANQARHSVCHRAGLREPATKTRRPIMAAIIATFPARSDNYGYLVHDEGTGRTAATDAPEEAAIVKALEENGWALTDIFITHHHGD